MPSSWSLLETTRPKFQVRIFGVLRTNLLTYEKEGA